jgi:hypothetical protein
MRRVGIVLLSIALASPAVAQFAQPVQPNPTNFGPGRIDASYAYQHIGQTITACGRAWHPQNSHLLLMGVPPYGMVANLPQWASMESIDNQLSNKIICVTGLVQQGGQPQAYEDMGYRSASITVTDPKHAILGD